MNHAKFPFKQGWQLHSLTDKDEEYLFYLEEGKHTLRMEVQVGSLGEVFENVLDTTSKISLLSREILQITGTNPDRTGTGSWKAVFRTSCRGFI